MSAHSTRALRSNPPKLSRFGARQRTEARRSRGTSSPARKRTPRRPRKSGSAKSGGSGGAQAVHVVRLGRVLAIEYRHHGGGTYRHRFGRAAAEIFATQEGDALIIRGRFNVKPFIEDHQ